MELDKLFRDWGLPVPPVPERLRGSLAQVGDALFSTRSDGVTTGDVLWFVREALAEPVPDYLTVGHSGYGASSQTVFYYLVYRPLVLMIRFRWLTAYDDEETTGHGATVLTTAGDLIAAVDEAVAQGRLSKDESLVVVQSDFDDSSWQRFSSPVDVDQAFAIEWHQSDDAITAARESLRPSGG